MHQALYRKWRPKAFSDVCGQEHITSVLSWQVANNKLSHAYLFCGSRGTGKTTCAKILAKAANCHHTVNGNPCNRCEICRQIDCGTCLDVLEMDAASNTGVDYIRDIREEVLFTPSEAGTRVYIIDEVHMLSEGAFNALLKTLEEPPPKVIFILATTEMQEIPATILSRCQRFDFRRIAVGTIMERLKYIAGEEGITLTEEGARLVARLSQGGMRDAISLLELCAGEGKVVDAACVGDAAGVCGREKVATMVRSIKDRKYGEILTQISNLYRSAVDLAVFFTDLIGYYRDMMVQKLLKITPENAKGNGDILDYSDSELAELTELASAFRYQTLLYHVKLLEDAYLLMGRGEDKRICAEMTLLRLCSDAFGDSNEALSARIGELEEKLTTAIAGGLSTTQAAPITESVTRNESPIAPAPPTVPTPPSPKQTTAPAPEPAPQTDREYMGWVELVTQYEKVDVGGAPFLRSATALVDGANRLHIQVSDSFAKMLLQSNQAEGKLQSLAAAGGDHFSAVLIEVGQSKNKASSAMDDLF